MIRESLKKNDIEGFTGLIHDFESAARLIGAFDLSKRAQEIENAGRENNTEKIKRDIEGIMDEYRRLYESLSEIFTN